MLSTGQSGNIGVQSMSFCTPSSNPLPRFEANAVVCVLQECLDYLSLLKYVIPAEVDPRWNENYKTIKELYGGPGELKIIFRADLGLLPLIPSVAEKLQRDRYYAYCVVSDTTEELMKNGTYNSLQNTVDECVRTEEGEHILQVNCQIWAEQVKQLYDLICLKNIENQENFAKCAEAAVKLNAEVDNTIFLNGSKLAYLERWEAARLELHYCRMKMKEQELDNKLTECALMERMDAIVAGEVCTYLQASMKDMEDEIMVWTSQYNEEIERREQEINEFKEQISEQKMILEQLYFVRDERQQLIDECEAETLRAKEKAEYWKIVHRSATIIQSLWRGYIVRNQLGAFKGLWNVLSKRKKQAARARKKRAAQQRKIAENKAKTNSKNPKNR
ncbi:dynein regulatory complex protein 9 [Cephus cinctus]|uniref:Dynein regulatory complex protein 9 n=1 Tax=Cephus cinctus TaxID=211228 RepID=A0AAJ7BVC0_CEPCN|nr:dynein regulatory complex protein 9 [Cephus cinctus]XP_015595180.1 dynein regulatory complex protein 9 [Cephus cinctus]XP_024940792.1 dynein regulatory complex protein 9 [Cephus cinctus]